MYLFYITINDNNLVRIFRIQTPVNNIKINMDFTVMKQLHKRQVLFMLFLQGRVKDYDKFFQYIVLNNDCRVYLCLMESKRPCNSVPRLPYLDDMVRISRKVPFCNIWVIKDESEIRTKLKNKGTVSPFMEFVRTNDLKPCHIIAFDQWLVQIDKYFPKLKVGVLHSVMLSLMKTFSDCKCAQNMKHMEILTVSSLRFIDIKNDIYEKFPNWSFGIHRQETENKYVFGYMDIHSKCGFVTLADEHYTLVCGYSNRQNRSISEVVNSYVVIKRYMIITEIFGQEGAKNSEFIFFDLQDVQKIYSQVIFPTHFPSIELPKIHYNYHVGFTVIKKSSVSF